MKLLQGIKEVIKHKDLVYQLTYAEFKSKYKQSVLGISWAIFQPLSLTLIYTLIFTLVVQMPSNGVPYPIFVYSGLLPWVLFSTGLTRGINSIVAYSSLVGKIYFPREILVLSAVLGGIIDFMFGFLIFILMMIYYQVPFTFNILYIFVILVAMFFLTLGISLAFSGLNVFIRDINHAVPIAVQLWMYASPIIYPLSSIPQRYLNFYAINPVVGLIEGFRNIFAIGIAPNLTYLGYSLLISIIIFIIGYQIFKKLETKFADVI